MPTTSNNTPIPTTASEVRDEMPLARVRGSGSDPQVLLTQVTKGSVRMVKGRGQFGLLLIKPFTTELVGFGAAVGLPLDRASQSVIPLGDVFLAPPRTYLERRWALRRRIYWINQQQQLTEAYPAPRRARLLLSYLEKLVPQPDLEAVPDEILAKLVGLEPELIEIVRTEQALLDSRASKNFNFK